MSSRARGDWTSWRLDFKKPERMHPLFRVLSHVLLLENPKLRRAWAKALRARSTLAEDAERAVWVLSLREDSQTHLEWLQILRAHRLDMRSLGLSIHGPSYTSEYVYRAPCIRAPERSK